MTSKKKYYKGIIYITAIVSYFFSIAGLETIISYAVPFLLLVYPAVIVLILLTTVWVVDNKTLRLTILVVFIFGVIRFYRH